MTSGSLNIVIYSMVVLRILRYHVVISLGKLIPGLLKQMAWVVLHKTLLILMFFSSDINECEPTSDCMHQCNNTEGSYHCYCNEFFKVDTSDPKSCTRKFWSVESIVIIV